MSWRPQPQKKARDTSTKDVSREKKESNVISIAEHKKKVELLQKKILQKLLDSPEASTKAATILSEWLKKK